MTDATAIDATPTEAVELDAIVIDAIVKDAIVIGATAIDAIVIDAIVIDAVVIHAVATVATVMDAMVLQFPIPSAAPVSHRRRGSTRRSGGRTAQHGPARGQGGAPGPMQLEPRVCQLRLYEWAPMQGLSKRVPLLDTRGGEPQRGLADAARTHAVVQAARAEPALRNLKAAALPEDDVRRGNPAAARRAVGRGVRVLRRLHACIRQGAVGGVISTQSFDVAYEQSTWHS